MNTACGIFSTPNQARNAFQVLGKKQQTPQNVHPTARTRKMLAIERTRVNVFMIV
jgi:hypothetical protein